ncbi:translocase of chloroplast 120, chloroplastic-like [Andrographis paniculata]|uniref:translocase of chloroplast 120, chloroplastic-like n=1 Tax=Andrographis paniculata TaxID=175694 RepID=UPI0021E83807|nr:translocase of chloroplast 120, chloroplastic-like [Andrographis paniculata]XP_051144496.1 translocase of chloroplast 120, chloroplastic-like [Andrographis paniculata]
MENDVGFAEEAKIGERKAVERQLSEPSVEETVDLSFEVSKGSDEGDEVPEEIVGAESSSAGSESIASTKDGNFRLDDTMSDVRVHSDEVDEDRKLGEVFEEPCAALDMEDGVAETVTLRSEESCDEEKVSNDNLVGGEKNGSMDGAIAKSQKDDDKKILDSGTADGETEKVRDGIRLGPPNLKPASDATNKLSYLEVLTSRDAEIVEADSKGEPIHQMQDGKKLATGAETDVEKHETSKFQDIDEVGKFLHSDIPEIDSSYDRTLVNSEVRKSADSNSLKGHIHETRPQIEDADAITGSGASRRLESKSNGNTIYKIEQDAAPYTELQQAKYENSMAKDQKGGLPENSHASDDIILDDMAQELKKQDSECGLVEEVHKHGIGKEKTSGTASADTSTADQSEKNDRDTNLHPSLVDDSTPNQEREANPHSMTSKSAVQSSTPSGHQLVDATSIDASRSIMDRPEQEGVKDEKGSKEQEVRPVAGASSSSGNTSTSEHTPTHPAIVEHPAKLQGSVPQDKLSSAEKVESSSEISSANSSSPHSSGLKHTTPPQGPGSQSKEQGSRSATENTSTNVMSSTSAHPAGLGRAAPLPEPTTDHAQHRRVNGAVSAAQNQPIEEPSNGEAEEYDETREKLQTIRVKFLRLAHRLGQTPHNVVVAQVLYRLGLAEQLHGRTGGRVGAFNFDRASAKAEQLEAAGNEPLDFTCTIMVLGITGVGKSATINSIFDEVIFGTDAFQSGTKKVQDVVGTVQGIRVRVIDTPGLLPSLSDHRKNEKVLRSVKRFIKNSPPDIVLYLDRLDMQSRDSGDMPSLRAITEIFGPSIWFNAIVVLTHAAAPPPEGPNGTATSYDMFVTQRSHVVQQAIRQAAGDMRLMNPVSLVENHSACRTNRAGQRVLPNGQVWKPHLLLLSFASKILAEANTLLKLQDNPPGRSFAPRTRSPPLPLLLSSLLQSRPDVKLPWDRFGDGDDDIDDDLDDFADLEEESEYDQLPPFKSLTKAQLDKLSKEQRKAYYDEVEFREKLFMKKNLNDRRMLKKMQESTKDVSFDYHGWDGEVPVPSVVLPTTFGSDNPTHRYHPPYLSSPWVVRPIPEPNVWDHDFGYDGLNVERLFVVKNKVPISFSSYFSKDKNGANLQVELASSVKHGKGKATSLGFDMQSVGKDYAYTIRGETRFKNNKTNKAVAGFSATLFGDAFTCGLKVEDKVSVGKLGQILVSGGTIYGHGEFAYGGSLEATLKDKYFPAGNFSSTLGLSVMDWHGDLATGCNFQSQIPIGRHSKLIGDLNVNNRGSGQLRVRVNSSENVQILLAGLYPLAKYLLYIVNKYNMRNTAS